MDGNGSLATAVLLHLLGEGLCSGGEGHEESRRSDDCQPVKGHGFIV